MAGGEVFQQTPYRVRECDGCGLLYRDLSLSPAEFDRYYARMEFTRWETSNYYPTEKAVLSHLRTLPPGTRILDFGCSSGRLLAELCGDYQCFGFEINSLAAASAASKGLRMLHTDELEHESGFDAVVLVDVFEHLAEPFKLLNKLAAKLVKHGSLIIVTGNGDAPACRRDPAQFWYFRIVEHIAMLTRRSADYIAKELALEITAWENICHYDLTLREQAVLRTQNFSYWQFRNQTPLAKALQFVPLLRRARRATVAPTYTCSRDHALVVLKALK